MTSRVSLNVPPSSRAGLLESTSGTTAAYPPRPEAIPRARLEEVDYVLRYATSPADLEAIQRLRFEVFNVELGEGLEESWLTGLDADEFDGQCHHLIVEHRSTAEVVGTYRIQTTAMAREGAGFYTDSEFDLSGLPEAILERAVEVGRACVAKQHRHKRVLFLLWKGLGLYVNHTSSRYLFGPCSLTGENPLEAARALAVLDRRGKLDRTIPIVARAGFECPVVEIAEDSPETLDFELPPLFEIYLRYAGKVCGEPVLDRRFHTIDFFVLCDIEDLAPRARRLFFGGP